MRIILHRAHQIGGCITEIIAKNGKKIIIDLGSNLPSSNHEKTDYSENDIRELTKDASAFFTLIIMATISDLLISSHLKSFNLLGK